VKKRLRTCLWVLVMAALLSSCGGGGDANAPPPPPSKAQLTVNVSGTGTVTSSPAGISCPTTCNAGFTSGTLITLSATAASSFTFSGFAGPCTGMTCTFTLNTNQTVSATFAQQATQDLTAINHIIFMLQENRSFDHYLGHLSQYWSANNLPQATNGTSFDGEPASASNQETTGPTATNSVTTIKAYPLTTNCVENPSPSWNESHVDYDWHNTFGPYLGDGFVHTAEGETNVAGPDAGLPYFDQFGLRVMGFYTDSTLNYYYFMASAFGTSDRWFSPVLSRTEPNRMYLIAGTSDGHAYPIPPCTAASCPPPVPSETIFEALDKAGVSWKIYRTDTSPSFLSLFSYYSAPGVQAKIVPVNPDYFNDLAAGTLPQVAMIEAGYGNGLDEHATGDDTIPSNDVQAGAAYVSSLINGLMKSTSWSSSVFILSWDEGGGFYDHVAPQLEPNPDGILPTDLRAGDICTNSDGSTSSHPTCRFETTGYRVPLIVVSPFSKKNFVSHTVRDYTAITKLIEMRYGLPNLTARDAAQPDMLEFFDFGNVPWGTHPTPPEQSRAGSCVIEVLNAVTITTTAAAGQATVSLTLNKAAVQNVTVELSGSSGISGLPSSVSIAAGSSAATPFTISAPSGTTVTVTGSIGGIPVSGMATIQ